MTTLQVKIVNVETGEEIVRDANAEELAQLEIDSAKTKAKIAEAKAKETARQAVLNRLGITEAEAELLFA